MISLEQLLRVPRVDADHSFDISPDGATVAFSWNITGRWELYTLAIDRSTGPQLLSPGTGSRFNPKFSPLNPKTIACVVDFDGAESFHLLLIDLSNCSTLDLTPGDTLQPGFAWSPDGSQLAFISNRSGCFDVYTLTLSTGLEHLVCSLGHPAWDVSWSPDGYWLAVTVESNAQDNGIYLVPTIGGEAVALTGNEQPLNAKEPCWSPDGKKLAFCATCRDFSNIGVLDLDSGQLNWLTDNEDDKSSPTWDAKGEQLTYIHSRGTTNRLLVQILHRDARTFVLDIGIHANPCFTPDNQHLLVIFENPQNPPDLWILSLETGLFQPLTNSLPAEIDKNNLPNPAEISYPGLAAAGEGDLQIPALIYNAQSASSSAAAVINIHGGPNWHYSQSWNPFMAHLASRGWVVLAPNYRGSTGYGQKWQNANYRDMGGCDTRDVSAGAHYLIREGLADPARIAITGRSHGGYLTMTCLTQYPELWAAGSGEVPFFNMFTSHAASREDLQHWNIETMGDPVEFESLWRERSPYFFLERVRAPIQILCGGLDPRCPAVDSIAAHEKLLLLEKSVDFLLYPNEGHTFLDFENILDAETQRVEFLARALDKL